MPKQDHETYIEADEITDKDEPRRTPHDRRGHHRWPMIFGLVAVTGLLIITAAMAARIFLVHNRMQNIIPPSSYYNLQEPGSRSVRHDMMFRGNQVPVISNSDLVSGVVTSVGSNSFTVAGNGVQYTVTTSDTTTYNSTNKKVSVNDSVVVIGKITDKTIAANDVQVVNQ